ncbi:MAG: hypothetical protein CSA66_06300 [Proteobacteria bacterium]|nr:MAG: hypothetical protein CSA66_06300 [Pseudomonadota bacterium]
MGAVYRARHCQTGGDVAVKFLHGTAALDSNMIKRFQLEAQNAAALRHTNTIRVTDFGVDDGTFYLVMEYLDGRPLSDVIRDQGPLPWRRAAHIAAQVLKSLWEAHEHGRQIIHRDIKPANIVLLDLPGSADHVKVLDFGIARSLAGTGAGTQGFIGTPFYMAPELWRGEEVDATTDLYALGCVVFQMLAGAPPFTPPPSATDILLPLLAMHCHDDPPATVEAAPDTPPGLAAWVDRLLKKDRAERIPSAREALAQLEAAVSDAEQAEVAPSPPSSAPASAPGLAPASAPGLAPASAPGLAPASAPGLAPASAPTPTPAPGPEVLQASAVSAAGLKAGPPPSAGAETTTAGEGQDAPSPPERRGASGLWVGLGVLLLIGGVATALYLGAAPDGDPSVPGVREVMIIDQTQPIGARTQTYRARLSERDHLHVDGGRHRTAGQVIVQDRMNNELLGQSDPEDTAPGKVLDPNALDATVALIDGLLPPSLAQRILNDTPLIEVDVYDNGLAVEVLRD